MAKPGRELIEPLRQALLANAQQGRADGVHSATESDGSQTVTVENGDWRFHDNFFGGEPYGGREVVFLKDRPVWMQVYYGYVEPGQDYHEVFDVLKKALLQPDEDVPGRGPLHVQSGEWEYAFIYQGDLEHFDGIETIRRQGKEVYKAIIAGGLVDQRDIDG